MIPIPNIILQAQAQVAQFSEASYIMESCQPVDCYLGNTLRADAHVAQADSSVCCSINDVIR